MFRVEIELMRHATPRDIEALLDLRNRRDWPDTFGQWVAEHYAFVTLHERSISRFALIRGGGAVCLYSAGPGRKSLVIGFCDKAEMLSMPLAATLQYFPPHCDLLVLRDPSRNGFTRGIPGHAVSFTGLLDALARDFDFAGYRGVRCLGMSGGGAAALACGVVLKADRAACFSGHYPSRGSHASPDTPVQIEAIIRGSAGARERFFAVYGAGNEPDARGAREIAETFAMTLCPVNDISQHNVVIRLHRQGQLSEMLARIGLNV
ncbi:MAG: hypothetical protein WD036_06150 [Bauldia sp.]